MSEASQATGPQWKGPRSFVGREEVLGQLLTELGRAVDVGGRVLFMLGPAGSGKTALLDRFCDEAPHQRSGLVVARADSSQPTASRAEWEILARRLTLRQHVRETLLSKAPEWLQVVPLVGKLAGAVVATVRAFRGGPTKRPPGRAGGARVEQTATEHVREILAYEPAQPRLIVIDGFEAAEADALAGAFALIRQLAATRTLLVLAARTTAGRPPSRVNDLLLESERLGRAVRLQLEPLSTEEISMVVSTITRGDVDVAWPARIAAESDGWPGAVWDYLAALEHNGLLLRRGRHWRLEGPPPAAAAVGAGRSAVVVTAAALPPSIGPAERRLLAFAALEGTRFHSVVLAEAAGLDELEVEDSLARLVRAGILRHAASEVSPELSSAFDFVEPGMARVAMLEIPPAEQPECLDRVASARRRLEGLPPQV